MLESPFRLEGNLSTIRAVLKYWIYKGIYQASSNSFARCETGGFSGSQIVIVLANHYRRSVIFSIRNANIITRH
jgi:hypothetical protein